MPAASPPTRADAARNRATLLEAATRVFRDGGPDVSLREVAREAGVGIATLYRHFPTREDLVAAVYADQVVRLTKGAGRLLTSEPPVEALRRWGILFGEWVATKQGMLKTLLAMIESGSLSHAQTHTDLIAAIDDILQAGRDTGAFRESVTAEDVAAHLIGIFTVAPLPDHRERADRLLDTVVEGIRSRPGTDSPSH